MVLGHAFCVTFKVDWVTRLGVLSIMIQGGGMVLVTVVGKNLPYYFEVKKDMLL
jgi:hypothetical protein